MPTTRGDIKRQQHYQNTPTEMSPTDVSFSVSEPFQDQSNPDPIRSSKAVRECLNDVAFSMGERISSNSRFTVSPTALPTRTYGQEATLCTNPNQRNKDSYTVGAIIRAAKEVEDRVWNTEEGRAKNRESLSRTIRKHQQKIGIEGSSSPGTTTPRDRDSPGGDDHGPGCNQEKTISTHRKQDGGSQSRRLPQHSDYGTIAPSSAARWLIKEAGYSTHGLERTVPSNTTLPFTSSSEIPDSSTSPIPSPPKNA
jgi:hypothetical protein